MTREQAEEALRQGKKVRHSSMNEGSSVVFEIWSILGLCLTRYPKRHEPYVICPVEDRKLPDSWYGDKQNGWEIVE
jgi:hypothetical protein